jgi:DNA-binding NtrC family response regulator
MNPPRVLVVEDRPSVLKLMATILGAGHEVTTASDGAAALTLLGETAFDVVLTDVRMPGASGFEVLRAVRDGAARTSVVLMTAYANVPDAVAAMRLGAYDYVAKPLEADEIALVVARAAEHARQLGGSRPLAALPGPDGHAAEERLQDLSVGFRSAVEQARDRASAEYLDRLMRHFHGNVTQAAAQAGMTRESLHRVLKQHGIRPERFREPGQWSDDDAAEVDGATAPRSQS